MVKGDYATYAGNYGATVVAVNSAALLGYDVVKIPGGSHGVMTFAHIEKTSLIWLTYYYRCYRLYDVRWSRIIGIYIKIFR